MSSINPGLGEPFNPFVTTLFEILTSVIYTGYAVRGSATSAALWTIRRVSFDGSGSPTAIEWAHDAIWDDRATETYL